MKSNGKSLILLSFLGYKLFLFRIKATGFSRASSLKAVSERSRMVMKSNGKSLILLSFLGYKLILFRIINCWFLKSFFIKSCLRKIKVSLVSLPTVTQISKCTFKFDPISGMGFDQSRFYRINSLLDHLQLSLLEIEALVVALCSRIDILNLFSDFHRGGTHTSKTTFR
jgi:hypothetical protein